MPSSPSASTPSPAHITLKMHPCARLFNCLTGCCSCSCSSSSSSTPHRRCLRRVPLFVAFIVAAVFLSGALTALMWTTLNTAAVTSVDEVANRLHIFVMADLKARIEGIFNEMNLILSEWSSSPTLLTKTGADLQQFAVTIFKLAKNPVYLSYAKADGRFWGAMRGSNGVVFASECPMPSAPNRTQSVTFWNVDANNQAVSPNNTQKYDTLTRPWYTAVLTHHKTAFASPFQSVTSPNQVVTLSKPIYNADGSLNIILVITYTFDTFFRAMHAAHQSLRSSGMVLLLGNDNNFLAVAADNQPTLKDDIAEVQALFQNRNIVDYTSFKHTFKNFGQSYVLQLVFDGKSDAGLDAAAMNWKLIIVLPLKDIFSTIWRNNTIVSGYATAYFVAFLIVFFIICQFSITRPLRNLAQKLDQLQEVIRAQHNLVPTFNFSTCFTEIGRLYASTVGVISAAQEMAQIRAEEASRAIELQRAEEEAQSLMRAKDLFLAMMSHEMRTPLTACIGMAEILLETTELSPKQKECVEIIQSEGSRLLELINDVLDFSKIEADKLLLETAPFNVREVIEQAACVVQHKADEKGLDLVVCVKSTVPRNCVGDAARLTQVLLNLLSNAVKFTHSGIVSLFCDANYDNETLTLDVADTGIGLSPSSIDRLFQPFVQADASTTRRYGGTGLGLVISKKIVDLWGGTLSVHSDGEGRGSRFTVVLPFLSILAGARGSSGLVFAPQMISLPTNPIIIVIDDHQLRRQALCELLATMHLAFYVFDDVASMDEMMASPMHPATRATIVITYLVCHLNDIQAHYETMSAAGTTEETGRRQVLWITQMKPAAGGKPPGGWSISMPVTLVKLHEALSHNNNSATCTSAISTPKLNPFAGHRNGQLGGSKSSPESASTSSLVSLIPMKSARILVVDDVIVNQQVICMKLRQRGFHELRIANNGREAVEETRRAPFVYDFILVSVYDIDGLAAVPPGITFDYVVFTFVSRQMDVMMPELNGYDATRQIRADERYADVPIIGITGNCAPNDLHRCLECGMSAVIGKPIDSKRLYYLLENPDEMSQRFAKVAAFGSSAPLLSS